MKTIFISVGADASNAHQIPKQWWTLDAIFRCEGQIRNEPPRKALKWH